MRAAFRPFFWFLLPWLIILLMPQLRVMLRVQAVGSEYEDSDAITPLSIWIHPLPPTAHELERAFPAHATKIRLKAPQNRGDSSISPQIAVRELDAALQKPDAPLWMLATRLRLALNEIPSHRSFPSESRFDWGQMRENNTSSELPIAGIRGWNDYEDYGVVASAPMPPMGNTPSPVIKPLNLAQQRFVLPLRLAKRGSDAEPDNAFWPLQTAYLLTLAQHDDAATQQVFAAAKCPRYDSHRRDEMRAALDVAHLHRALLWQEKLEVATRQSGDESFRRDQALLWLAERAEKRGDFSVSAALARISSRMQSTAAAGNEARRALLLQSAVWAGANRPAHVGSLAIPIWPPQLSAFGYGYGSSPLTPLDFARPFANAARRKGHADLAREALAQGRDATRFASRLPMRWSGEHFGTAPMPIVPAAICDFNATMALLQVQITGFLWLLLSFLLWRRMSWAWELTARAWQVVGLIWRVRDKPLDDEVPVEIAHTPREVRRSVWFCGALVLLGAPGMTWWSDAISRWDYAFWQSHQSDWQVPFYLAFVAGPLIGGCVWCGSAALWRYARLQAPSIPREETETYALHIPPSIIPRAVLLMCWSITAGMALSWLLWLITRKFGPMALNFSLPPLWAHWLGGQNPGFDLSVRDVGLPVFLGFVTLGVWLVKWCWQLHLRRRVPALLFALRWLRATLGVWLILGSWLYLVFLLIALPYHRAANEAIDKQFLPNLVTHINTLK